MDLKITLCTMSLGVCHAKPFFIFNTFSDDQHTDALIVGLFQICLITYQSLGVCWCVDGDLRSQSRLRAKGYTSWRRYKEKEEFKFIVLRNARGSTSGKGGGGGPIFIDEPSPQLVYLNYLPISASFGVKRVL